MRHFYQLIMIIMMLSLISCTSGRTVYAPVSSVGMIEPIPQAGAHRVQSGETLYSIAWRYGLDYRYVAKRNHIDPPYRIMKGEVIYLRGRAPVPTPVTPHLQAARSPVVPPQPIVQHPPKHHFERIEKEPTATVTYWQWPARGPVIKTFSDLNKGVNIKGRMGDPVLATAPGKVVYSGSGLRGYGNLIIIKHNSLYLTAYAHNSSVLVQEGEWVRRGQQIARMGNTGTQQVMLHFEIRRGGQPVNPLSYLAKK
jgi:lipoprotein NlpD